jgi:hypothetical protein
LAIDINASELDRVVIAKQIGEVLGGDFHRRKRSA